MLPLFGKKKHSIFGRAVSCLRKEKMNNIEFFFYPFMLLIIFLLSLHALDYVFLEYFYEHEWLIYLIKIPIVIVM